MCGLVGIASKTMSASKVDAFTKMLFIDTLRGFHSTGVLVGRGKPKSDKEYRECSYYKRALAGPDFIQQATYANMCKTPADIKFMMGHNRHATKGAVNDNNAHPFVGNYIVLAHNGSLDYHSNLCNGRGNQFTVDSEAVMWHLDDFDDDGLPDAIEDIHGAFSLTWYDKVEDALYFCRNEERPLYMATITSYDGKEDTGIMWASVPEFITYTANKHNITLSGEPQATEVGKLYKYTADGTRLLSEREVNVHVPKKYSGFVGRGNRTTASQTTKSGGNSKAATTQPKTSTSQAGQGKAVSSLPVVSAKSNTSSSSTKSGTQSGTTSSAKTSGTGSQTTAPKGTSTTDRATEQVIAAGAPTQGQWIEFCMYRENYVAGGDRGQQMGWMRCANGLRYTVNVGGVDPNKRMHGVYRGRVIQRYTNVNPVREGFSTDRFRVDPSSITKMEDYKLRVFDAKHCTQNYSVDRDDKAVVHDLSGCFPKGKPEDSADVIINGADTRRFYVGEDNRILDAYNTETLLVCGCGMCEKPITKDQLHAGGVDWFGYTPVHSDCIDDFLEKKV